MQIFPYGQAEIDHLKRHDKKLGAAMDALGMLERRVTPDLFAALLRSIVAQQISTKAVDTIWGRLRGKVGEVTPQAIAGLDVADIQQCGMSMRKAGYIKGIAEAAARGWIDLSRLPELADEEIITTLSSLPGVGVWTAEMLLIHSLCRPDVVSWGDLAIRRGMMTLYGLKTLTRIQFDRYRKRYSPHGSVASIYLWALSAR
ncbi:DNA-3-methyladenine glycosylase family protein [Fundidesulfovibrio putealis]|uniref:DNA-3-methyladenine glycosylase family protein n=1 Tax=Fundidesulfovibrio putealis TaxID=270496 RepID=UPI0003FA56C7|nr:DNA-3-methyladenine glycosylase [Fundidesulfovibrio putealis]